MALLLSSRHRSPLGDLYAVFQKDGALTQLSFVDDRPTADLDAEIARDWDCAVAHDPSRGADLDRELGEYFRGERSSFDALLAPRGSEFQLRVWSELLEIPHGETVSYGELARRIGNPAGARAVGAANGHNPIAIIVPCHRVIGENGKLVGYASGVSRKAWLLEHERAQGLLPLCESQTSH